MSDGGKGSKARPIEIPADVFDSNWAITFGDNTKCKATLKGCTRDDCTGEENCVVAKQNNCG